ncbi:DUF1707 domain-containing protein [Tessaracoccus sp. OS52]|uniref:DUF1707 domain-containing protein n=1 Tax=Tessaracoccus sp. OS52 TaxID=2886691 RepID=UPI001D1145F8|nr:DUF1707 domain-containing protein [Tessaracoccus sp. OS52]MCC2594245.1 DUF1707 domain-containing protein [Tessaracoccus sp. OS52]
MMQSGHGISNLRCADEDRELVARVLNNAYADGRLTFEEHDERISKAYNAKTFGELDGLTEDLIPGGAQPAPSLPEPPRSPLQPQHYGSPSPRMSSVPAAPHMFAGGKAILSTYRPDRGLVMPAYAELMAILGDVRIDLIDATFTARETTIKVVAMLGEVRIRIPEGVQVVSNLTQVLSDYKVDGAVPRADGVVLRIEGTSFMGEVKVLGPGTNRARKYEKFV